MENDSETITQDLLTELNLDTTEENNAVMSGLLKDAQELVLDSVNSSLSASNLADDQIFLRATKALATSMFYDRSLSQGIPIGVQLMITHLKGRYAKWPQSPKNGKALPTSPINSTTR